MDASNRAWQTYWDRYESEIVDTFQFDGVQIDTLGNPGRVLDVHGVPVHLGSALGPFAQQAGAATRHQVILNDVSEWALDKLSRYRNRDINYIEIHPEFNDVPYYPAINGLSAAVAEVSGLATVIAAYVETRRASNRDCVTGGGKNVCAFSNPGVQYIDAQIVASGLDHWELGELNRPCTVRQAKLTSNIYVSGPALCMDGTLQTWEQDLHNFEVSYEEALRGGTRDTPELQPQLVGLPSGIVASPVGAAGSIYVMPKMNSSMAIVHLLNFDALHTIAIDDKLGDQPKSRPIGAFILEVHLPDRCLTPGRAWFASPDVRHGAPLDLATNVEGHKIAVTVPSLDVWDMVVVQCQQGHSRGGVRS